MGKLLNIFVSTGLGESKVSIWIFG